MLKKFNVVRVRFHIEEKQILVLQGWKYEMPDGSAGRKRTSLDHEKI